MPCHADLEPGRARPSDPAVLTRLAIRFDSHDCRTDYYQDPDLDEILAHYRSNLTSSYLLLPSEGIRCLRALSRLRDWEGSGAPDIRIHGSFSIRVNYHAIGRYIEGQGGQTFAPHHRAAHLTVCAFTLGASPTGFAETRLAFTEAVERGGPDDFFLLKSGIEKNYTVFDLDEMLAYLRISGWDGRLFLDCYPVLLEKAPSASARLQDELVHALEHIWDNYFHLGEERDVPFNAGVLLFKLRRIREALVFFNRSLAYYGPSPSTLYNAAMCLAQQRQFGPALARIKEALALDPTFEPAISLSRQLQKYRPKRSLR